MACLSFWRASAVALRKESVDRNKNFKPEVRDWFVALRKESVDRNVNPYKLTMIFGKKSLSARRAWIEISKLMYQGAAKVVALRKESVDRNWPVCTVQRTETYRRSPQGERG